MWFRISRPDYFYLRHNKLLDAGDRSAFNRGWAQGFGFFVLTCRWNEDRSVSTDGLHYADHPFFTVVMNGDRIPIQREALSYEDVLLLEGLPKGASVTWWDKAGNGGNGSLRPGERIALTEGMVFNAAVTGRA